MREEWKDIPGYEGYYKISNEGLIKRLGRLCATYDGTVCPKALTDEVFKKALEAELPVSQYIEKPDCFEELPF